MCHIDLLEQNALTGQFLTTKSEKLYIVQWCQIQPACCLCLEFSFSHLNHYHSPVILPKSKYDVYFDAVYLYCTHINLYHVLCYLSYADLRRKIYMLTTDVHGGLHIFSPHFVAQMHGGRKLHNSKLRWSITPSNSYAINDANKMMLTPTRC